MRRLLPLVIVSLLFVSCSYAPSADTIMIANMDTTVRPQDDFFQYACGGWIASHPIPENKSKYSVSDHLSSQVDQQVLEILTDIVNNKQKPGSTNEKLAMFFKSGMDTVTVNAAGIEPIRFFIDEFNSMRNMADLQHCIALLQKHYLRAPFGIRFGPYLSNSSIFAFVIENDGLSLEDREFYLEDDEYYEEIRQSYKAHIEKMFQLLGQDSATAHQSANATYNIEYKIAEISLDIMQSLDRAHVIHTSSIADLTAKLPVFDWELYFKQLNLPIPDTIVVNTDDMYLPRLDTIMRQTPIDDWKAYLTYMLINGMAPMLDSGFVNENFDFKKRIMFGQEENDPRWKQVIDEMNIDFDDAVGKLYIKKYFPPQAKVRALEMAGNIKSALAEHIANCEWMCDSTKTKALNKLDKTKLKIGYSEEYVDYKDFTMCDTFATNVLTCLARYFEYEMSFINSEISDDLWYNILPHTVNMYYVYNQNEIIVPAAMLQPPYFYANGDDAVNYGAIGASIGHELTHGFDTQGQMFDQFGNLNDWWSDNDKTEFYRRAQKLVDRFNSFIVVDSMHADGDLTLCENVADLGGLLVAYTAFSKTEQWKDQTKLIDGLTPDQRFFIAFAQSWAGSYRNEAIRSRTKTDHHSLYRFRIEGTLPNINAFEKAFGTKTGDKYYLPDSMKTHIW